MWPGDPVRKAEQPRRGKEQEAAGEIEPEMDRHGDDAHRAELVVGQQAVDDGAYANDLRDVLRRRSIGKAQKIRRQDQDDANQIISHSMHTR